ncbi:unnamed protein product [Triticum turgidum subsp. durum]|uniref:Uncharacterized protein n=1 Tax=Triticum turgidum subsp. durum TaxID=4567 RepID=A0A9R0ZIS6_TRITD|nr:unnamed protein product [Triticum turgidum subsp. durum]
MVATSPQLSLSPQTAPPVFPHRRREVPHSSHSSQPLLLKSVAEVPEDPLELGMVAGRGTKADAKARDSSPPDRRPWLSCVATSAPGSFLSISLVGGSHHPVCATALRPAMPRHDSSTPMSGPLQVQAGAGRRSIPLFGFHICLFLI